MGGRQGNKKKGVVTSDHALMRLRASCQNEADSVADITLCTTPEHLQGDRCALILRIMKRRKKCKT